MRVITICNLGFSEGDREKFLLFIILPGTEDIVTLYDDKSY